MKSPAHRRARRALLLFAVCACGGARIVEFNAQPRRICAGDTVRMTFKTRCTPHLLAVRHGGTAADTTAYVLVAEKGGKTATSPMDVVTFSPAATPVLAFDTDLLGRDSLVARDSLSPEVWPDLVRLDDVFAESGRELVIRHAGKQDVVGGVLLGVDPAGPPSRIASRRAARLRTSSSPSPARTRSSRAATRSRSPPWPRAPWPWPHRPCPRTPARSGRRPGDPVGSPGRGG